jgi:hypothetical protein
MRRYCNVSLVAVSVIAGVAACAPDKPAGDGDGAPGNDGCSDGDVRCDIGRQHQVCVDGAWKNGDKCTGDDVCIPELGCAACEPGGLACSGDQVVRCDDAGAPTTDVVEDCAPLTCAGGQCVDPCSDEALDRTYSGCVFYAADLPQWGQRDILTEPASSQQFGVVVANPWDTPIDVVVTQNDAQPGQPAIITQVAVAQVQPRGAAPIALPMREVSGWVDGSMPNRSRLAAAAYRIETSRPATVYQFSPQNNANVYSDDASLLIPANALDENYIVLGWPGIGGPVFPGLPSGDNRPFITIVGTRANTRVRVVPSTGVMAGDSVPLTMPGEEIVVTLGPYETLNLEGGDYEMFGMTDFTGTRIEADGPIAVFSGAECVNINPPMPAHGDGCCCDHLEEQLYPRSSLGRNYAVARTEPRSNWAVDPEPEFFRILAQSDNTVVTTSLPPPDDQFTLHRAEWREVLTTSDFIIEAGLPVMVGQFLTSRDNTNTYNGDPDFILVPPLEQHRDYYVFSVPEGYAHDNVMLSLPQGGTVTIDGFAPTDCNRAPIASIAGVAYDAMRCPVASGSHIIDADVPVGLVVAGNGPGPVGYGYTGGMDFAPVNEDCTDDGDCPGGEFCSGGACVPIIE